MNIKNTIRILFITSLLFSACNDKNISPEPPAPEKTIAISDAAFKAFLLANQAVNTNGDDQLQESEARDYAGELVVTADKGIKSLEDIAHFPKLTALHCVGLGLENVNFTKNTELQTLNIALNKITALDISRNKKLKRLLCDQNQLTLLDLGHLSLLEELHCAFNNLVDLDIRELSALKKVEAQGNPGLTCILTERDNLSKEWVADKGVYWGKDCANAPKDAIVNIPDPNFKKTLLEHGISITDKALKAEYGIGTIDTNHDGEIQVTEAKAYKGTICMDGTLAEYIRDVEDFTGLEYFTAVDYVRLRQLPLLAKLNLSGNTGLRFLEIRELPRLTDVSVENCALLHYVYITKTGLSELSTLKNGQLKTLYLSQNAIKNLNMSQNPLLKELQCDINRVETIDVGSNPKLEILNISDNRISNLDITQCPHLVYLNCMGNEGLHNLDISRNTRLYDLVAHNKNLTCIKVSEEQLKTEHPYWFKSEKAVYRLTCE